MTQTPTDPSATDDWPRGLAAAPPISPRVPAPVPTVRPEAGTGLATIEEAIEAIRNGEIVIVVDDADRENEGDFVMAAQWATPAAVNFMVTEGRGLLCLPMTGERLDELGIGPMVPEAAGAEETAFTVSIDVEEPGNTGISAADRARCIKLAIDPAARPEQLRQPGHVFPLRARDGGVLEREGHTEAAVDLARLAGLAPAGVICEIMNPDGTMARLPDLLEVARVHGLLVVSIEDLIAYRRRTERRPMSDDRFSEAPLPTEHGDFRAVAFRDDAGTEHLALVHGEVDGATDVLVRVHSECLTGDLMGSRRCDCGAQLQRSLVEVSEAEAGVVVYVRGHEGRGIGLVDKLRAYALQDDGADTVDANLRLGHPEDARDYGAAATLLTRLGVRGVRLLTNNPSKVRALVDAGIAVGDRVALQVAATEHNLAYLRTKRDRMGHHLPALGHHTEDDHRQPSTGLSSADGTRYPKPSSGRPSALWWNPNAATVTEALGMAASLRPSTGSLASSIGDAGTAGVATATASNRCAWSRPST